MPKKPTPLAVIPDNIPEAIKSYPQWFCWKYVLKNFKWTKPPFQPDGSKASPTEPKHYSAFGMVLAAYEKGAFDGIGFVLTASDPFVAIDIDHFISGANELSAFAKEMLHLFDSYAEISPSGEGLRIIVKGTLPRNIKKPEIEMYHCDRYFTITGHLVS